jgi:hypothetical protein
MFARICGCIGNGLQLDGTERFSRRVQFGSRLFDRLGQSIHASPFFPILGSLDHRAITLLSHRGIPARSSQHPRRPLLRNYAKRKRKITADNSVSAVIGALAAGFLGA